jgi:chemotaxis methyl-accepting protein methylase
VASRAKRTSSWQEPLEHVSRAKKFMERFGVHEAHPDEYLDKLPSNEQKEWDELLKKI